MHRSQRAAVTDGADAVCGAAVMMRRWAPSLRERVEAW